MGRLEKAKDHGIDWKRATLKKKLKALLQQHKTRPCTRNMWDGEYVQSICCAIAQTPTTLEMVVGQGGGGGGCHVIYIEVFSGDSSWFSIRTKFWWVYFSFINKHVLQNNCLNKIPDDRHCDSFTSVDSYNSCINYSCK